MHYLQYTGRAQQVGGPKNLPFTVQGGFSINSEGNPHPMVRRSPICIVLCAVGTAAEADAPSWTAGLLSCQLAALPSTLPLQATREPLSEPQPGARSCRALKPPLSGPHKPSLSWRLPAREPSSLHFVYPISLLSPGCLLLLLLAAQQQHPVSKAP